MTLVLLDYHALCGAEGAGQMQVSGQHEQVIVVRKGGQVELRDTLRDLRTGLRAAMARGSYRGSNGKEDISVEQQ